MTLIIAACNDALESSKVHLSQSKKLFAIALIVVIQFAAITTVLEKNALALSFGNIVNVSNTVDGDSSVPQVAAAGDNVHVVWEDDGSGDDEILYAKSGDGGASFSDPVIISTTPSSPFEPRLATSDSGNEIYAVWKEEGEIYFNASTDNATSFTEPINISNSGNNSHSSQIATSGDFVYVAWEEDVASTNREIFISVSDNDGSSFSDPVNLSNSSFQSSSIELYATGGTVFVVWKEFDSSSFVGNIFFSLSTDGGENFSGPTNLSGVLGGDAFLPQLAASGSSIYVVWGDAINLDTFLVVSTNGGQNFTDPVNLSNSTFVFAANPDIVASGDSVYVVWQDEIAGLADVFLVPISDAGSTIGNRVNISNSSSSISISPKVVISDTNPETIYVVWREDSPADVFLAFSTDAGASFEDPVNLSSSNSVSAFTQVSASGNRLHVVWEDSSLGQFEIFTRTLTESGPPSISIDFVSDSTPRWDLDPVSISGTVNGNSTDTINIDWGDGEDDPVSMNGSSWGPVSHPYGSASTGTRVISVQLLDEFDVMKAAASTEIEVQKHATNLTIDGILSVVQGEDVNINGVLTDRESNLPVNGRNVTFTGTGVTAALLPAITLADGTYSSSGSSPDLVNDDPLTVQAHFAGDSAYEASDSNIMGYDTVAAGTAEFLVPSGEPSGPIELTGFNASVIFDQVLTGGSIFVSECTPPQSTRYVEVDGMCLKISSAVQLEDDASVHIAMFYDELSIPMGFSEEDLDMFHDSASGIVDMTESRNTDESSITGRTTEFSRFIGGVALHSDPPVGAERLPIFVGDNNDLVFVFPQTRNLAFSSEELTLNDINIVSVVEPYGNINSDELDTIKVAITSVSDPSGINITFHETDLDSGIFQGSVTLTTGSSSELESMLLTSPGEEISASYSAPGMAPFRVIISGVIEAGVAEVSNSGIPSYLRSGPNLVDVYELRLVDANLGPDANVTVIMSYANFSDISDPLQLGIATVDSTDCFEVISLNSTAGINESEKTIFGYSTTEGRFALVRDDHIPADRECFALGVPPGGGGGGLPRPGTGIILLDKAAAVGAEESEGTTGGGGGGGSGSRSAGIAQTPSGNDVETTVSTRSGPVTIRFEMVQADSGQLKVESNELSAFEDIFEEITVLEQDNDEHGIVHMGGRTYLSASDVFDIDASAINFDGMIDVTIPYDEGVVVSISGSESDVRFLHYDEEQGIWEDNTMSVDKLANTVTGRLDSLSPVIAAVIINQDKSDQLVASDPSFVFSEGRSSLSVKLSNKLQTDQTYAIIAQVLDQNNVVQHIEWQERSISASREENVSMSWAQMEESIYVIKVFVWTEMENPTLLSHTTVQSS